MPITDKDPSDNVAALPVAPVREASVKPAIENDDGRARGDWQTRYPTKVWCAVTVEAAYLVLIFVGCLLGLFYTWLGAFSAALDLQETRALAFNRYLFYLFGGMLGGVLFGVKWLYHSVARGFWNLDRQPWRYLVPILSAGFALASSFIIEAGLSRMPASGREPEYVAVGFLIGYFSDKAISMLSRVADVIFGSPEKRDR
jgi:hypothetical protein